MSCICLPCFLGILLSLDALQIFLLIRGRQNDLNSSDGDQRASIKSAFLRQPRRLQTGLRDLKDFFQMKKCLQRHDVAETSYEIYCHVLLKINEKKDFPYCNDGKDQSLRLIHSCCHIPRLVILKALLESFRLELLSLSGAQKSED